MTSKSKRRSRSRSSRRSRHGNAVTPYRVVEGVPTIIGRWYVDGPDGKRYGPFSERGAHHEADMYARWLKQSTAPRTPRTPRLITSENTRRAEKAVRSAAAAKFGRGGRKDFFFEHGQWWLTIDRDDETDTYSAVDTNLGIDFERV